MEEDRLSRLATGEDFIAAGFAQNKDGSGYSMLVQEKPRRNPWEMKIERYGTLHIDAWRWRVVYFGAVLYFNTMRQFRGLCDLFEIGHLIQE